jgi:inner membrane protein
VDNVCHSLLGAALGKAGLARRTPLGMSTLVVANNLPDVDVAVFATDTLAMSFRRGWTHGVLAQLLLPMALTGVMLAWDRVVRRRGAGGADPARAGQLLLLSYVGVVAHVFLDYLNSYGVRLLMPFSERWFYGDALFIVDPWMYLALGAGWWWSWRREPRGLAASVPLLVRAGVCAVLSRAGRPADTRFMVTPVFGNPFRREVVIDVGDRYERGHLWFQPLPHFRPAGFGLDHGMGAPDVQALLQQPRARAFLRWSRFPFVQVEPGPPPAVWINDYRYSNAGPYGWSAVKLQ